MRSFFLHCPDFDRESFAPALPLRLLPASPLCRIVVASIVRVTRPEGGRRPLNFCSHPNKSASSPECGPPPSFWHSGIPRALSLHESLQSIVEGVRLISPPNYAVDAVEGNLNAIFLKKRNVEPLFFESLRRKMECEWRRKAHQGK